MKRKLQLSVFLLITIIFTGCSRVEPPKIPANYFYEGSYVDIYSPNQEGWSLMNKSTQGIVFAKDGKEKGSSFVAQVSFFPLQKETKSKNEFLNLIKKSAEQDINKDRYDLIESNFALYEKRNYTCVMAKTLTKDKKAKISPFNTKILLMGIKSLYCKDPKATKRAFMVGYSYRGEFIYPNLDVEADSFIDGVRLTIQNTNNSSTKASNIKETAFLKAVNGNITIKSIKTKQLITYKKSDAGFYLKPTEYIIEIMYKKNTFFDESILTKYLFRFKALPNHTYQIKHSIEGSRVKIWIEDLTISKKVSQVIAVWNAPISDELDAEDNSYFYKQKQKHNIFEQIFFNIILQEIIN